MSFQAPALPPVARTIRSLIAMAQRQSPEIAAFPCVDPVETAADLLQEISSRSLLVWDGNDQAPWLPCKWSYGHSSNPLPTNANLLFSACARDFRCGQCGH